MGERNSLPVVERTTITGRTSDASAVVHGVVLAAGTSSRYGARNKLLEPLDGKSVVAHAVESVVESDVDAVTVIVGHDADRVTAALDHSSVEFRRNERFRDGQATSLAEGIAAARERDADAVLVALGDMPSVSVESVNLLIETYNQGVGTAVAASCDGKRGNPVLFDAQYFDALVDVEGDVGGREILLSEPDAVAVETGDSGVLRDIDEPEDM